MKRIASDASQGIVTRWKNSRDMAEEKRKLSLTTSPKDNLFTVAMILLPCAPLFRRR